MTTAIAAQSLSFAESGGAATLLTEDYHRMNVALQYIQCVRPRQPALPELAERVGLSPFHFQRLFTRWVGVSPKRFASILAVTQAQQLLRTDASVLRAAVESGVSGPGRLHDLFVRLEGVTPGEYKAVGCGLDLVVGACPSPFGHCLLGVTPRGVCWLSFDDDPSCTRGRKELRETWPQAALRSDARLIARTGRQIFRPETAPHAPLAVLVRGTNFQVKVWEALLRIPAGQVTTYGDIGQAIGHPTAARAIGQACAANQVSYLIPCHRVIRTLGLLGSYRWGVERKHALLVHEAAVRTAQGAPAT